jgi:hypothetical protein
MRTLGTLAALGGAAIVASAALFACGSGDDTSVPVPHFDGSAEGSGEASADATADAPQEVSAPEGAGGDAAEAGAE